MQANTANARQQAYTSIRTDIANLVPEHARCILDIGCSNGALGAYLKSRVAGRQVFGIEYDPAFATVAAQTLDGVVHADAGTLDWQTVLGDRQFDCLIFADVLEHLAEPARCLESAIRRLAPGGCVVASLPNVRHVSALWSIFVKGTFPRRDRGIFDRTHLRWFTNRDAINLFSESGLHIASASYALRWRDKGGGPLNRMLNKLPLAIQRLTPIREYFAYQVAYRAEVARHTAA